MQVMWALHTCYHVIFFLQENIFTVPNLLSVMRIAISPVLGYLIVYEAYLPALVLFTAAGITDVVRTMCV